MATANPKDIETLKIFGEAVRRIRNEQNISILELANRCEVDYSTISRIERGLVNTTITMVTRIAKALQVNPSILLD